MRHEENDHFHNMKISANRQALYNSKKLGKTKGESAFHDKPRKTKTSYGVLKPRKSKPTIKAKGTHHSMQALGDKFVSVPTQSHKAQGNPQQFTVNPKHHQTEEKKSNRIARAVSKIDYITHRPNPAKMAHRNKQVARIGRYISEIATRGRKPKNLNELSDKLLYKKKGGTRRRKGKRYGSKGK